MKIEKVKIKCGKKFCGCEFEVEREAIIHDEYAQCPFCGWQSLNPYYEGERDEIPRTKQEKS